VTVDSTRIPANPGSDLLVGRRGTPVGRGHRG
jgi:hypothetical protein